MSTETDLHPGDRVKYRTGRGYGEGSVANVSAGKVLINTAKGKSVTRKLGAVEKLPPIAATPLSEPCSQAQAATEEGDCV